jgi:hypothetical protein
VGIDRVLHNNTEAAMRFIAGDTSGVKHHALAAEALSAIWFRARMEGREIEDIQPDGVADLSCREPAPHRHRELVTVAGVVPIRPDCLFKIAGVRYALEVETGTSSAAKVRMKACRYARLIESSGAPLRVLIHCSSNSHARLVTAAFRSSIPPSVAASFVVLSSEACDHFAQCQCPTLLLTRR